MTISSGSISSGLARIERVGLGPAALAVSFTMLGLLDAIGLRDLLQVGAHQLCSADLSGVWRRGPGPSDRGQR